MVWKQQDDDPAGRELRQQLAKAREERDYYRAIAEQAGMKALGDAGEFMKIIRSLRRTEDILRDVQDGLENTVADRTAELTKANQELAAEIQERRVVEQALRESEERYRRQEERLNRINSGLLNLGHDYEANMNIITAMCGELLGADCALYCRVDGDQLCLHGKWNAPADIASYSSPRGHICFDVILQDVDQPLVVRNLQQTDYVRTDPNVAAYGLSTYVGHPVRFGGKFRGSLCAVYTRDLELGAEDLHVIGILAAAIAQEEARAEAVDALRQSEQGLKEAQQLARMGSWDYSVPGNHLTWSDEVYRIFGLDPRTTEPSPELFFGFVHPDDRANLRSQITSGTPNRADYRILLKDGSQKYIHEEVSIEYDEDGRPVKVSGTAQDITDRKRAEEALQRSETLVRDIIDNVDEAILLIDRDYRIMTANRSYCLWARSSLDEICGRPCYEVTHHLDRPCHEAGRDCAVKETFATGKSDAVLFKSEDGSGNRSYVEKRAFPVKDAAGKITAAIETVRNVTDHHLLEEERLKTQKLEAIGTLAGGIAHDFNNLLQGVFGYLSLARMNLDQKDKAGAMLDQAEKALHMSVNLTSQLLTFSKGGRPQKKRIALLPVIENAARFALSGSRSHYRLSSDEKLWHVDADEGQMGQVIQNIVLNASEAMPEGATVMISASNMYIPEGSLASLPAGGRFVRVTIRDTGVGIPEKYLAKIFDPYFTTKQTGSGLGLATSYSIIRNHGGAIDAVSEPDRGTSFMVYLPACDPGDEEDTSASPAPGRPGRILLMDDEEMVRQVASEMLQALGHTPVTVKDGQEAVDAYLAAGREGRPFDAVILDLTVKGGMGGEEAVKKLLEADPGVRAVVSSGYADNAVVADYRAYGFAAYLNKPYRIDALRDCLTSLLQRP